MATLYSYAQNTFPANGYVGIGTSSPQAILDLGNNGNSVKQLMFSGNIGYYMGFGVNLGQAPNTLTAFIGPPNGDGTNGTASFSVASANSTWPYSAYTTRLTVLSTGNVGIGTTSPGEILTIGNETPGTGRRALRIGAGSFSEPAALNTASNGDKIILYDATTASYDARIGVGSRGNFWMKSFGYVGSNEGSFEWYVGTNNTAPQMVLSASGALSIGTSNPYTYMLAVNGSAIATSVTVKANTNWPDYVFKKDYRLPQLSDVKAYLDKNHHLSEIPSEQEIIKDGQNLGEMNKLLLKKVEELTLYIIETRDKQEKQNAKVDELEKKLNELLQNNAIKK